MSRLFCRQGDEETRKYDRKQVSALPYRFGWQLSSSAPPENRQRTEIVSPQPAVLLVLVEVVLTTLYSFKGLRPLVSPNACSPISRRAFLLAVLGIWWTSLRFTQVLKHPEEVPHESLSTTPPRRCPLRILLFRSHYPQWHDSSLPAHRLRRHCPLVLA